MNRLFSAGWFVVLVLAGCAGGPMMESTSQPGQSTTSDTDADARGRARIHTELAAGYLELKNLAVALEEAAAERRGLLVGVRDERATNVRR